MSVRVRLRFCGSGRPLVLFQLRFNYLAMLEPTDKATVTY
jgi:hypothetical protein